MYGMSEHLHANKLVHTRERLKGRVSRDEKYNYENVYAFLR